MKSLIASLRSLTLPFGATEGERIELDGINGEIRVYDADGDLLIKIDGEFGFEGYDTSENVRIRVSSPLGGAYSAIQMWTASPNESAQGFISVADFGPTNRMVITPGEQGIRGAMEWTLMGNAHDDSLPAMLQAVTLTLVDASNPRPVIDLTGAGAGLETHRPRTVIYDLWYGEPNLHGQEPDYLYSAARGGPPEYRHRTATADVARAAGVNTSATITGDFDANRIYQFSAKSSMTVGTAAVVYAIELSEGGTTGANNGTIVERLARIQAAEVPAGALSPFLNASVLFSPSSSGTKTYHIRNGTGSGGTILLGGGVTNRTFFWAEDMGLA